MIFRCQPRRNGQILFIRGQADLLHLVDNKILSVYSIDCTDHQQEITLFITVYGHRIHTDRKAETGIYIAIFIQTEIAETHRYFSAIVLPLLSVDIFRLHLFKGHRVDLSDMEKLRKTSEILDREEFNAAVNAIIKAKRVYILGVRSVEPLANFLGYYLNYMFNNVHIVSGFGTVEMFEKIVGVNSEDVVIAFSFPRYSSTATKGAQYCRSAGATVIGITDNRLSPLGSNSDHVLIAKSDMVSLVDSLVAPLSVINALIVAIASKKEKELARTFENLERIWDEYDVYEKQVEKR